MFFPWSTLVLLHHQGLVAQEGGGPQPPSARSAHWCWALLLCCWFPGWALGGGSCCQSKPVVFRACPARLRSQRLWRRAQQRGLQALLSCCGKVASGSCWIAQVAPWEEKLCPAKGTGVKSGQRRGWAGALARPSGGHGGPSCKCGSMLGLEGRAVSQQHSGLLG